MCVCVCGKGFLFVCLFFISNLMVPNFPVMHVMGFYFQRHDLKVEEKHKLHHRDSKDTAFFIFVFI